MTTQTQPHAAVEDDDRERGVEALSQTPLSSQADTTPARQTRTHARRWVDNVMRLTSAVQ